MKKFFKKIYDIITVKVYRNQVIRYHESLAADIKFLNTQLFLQNPVLLIGQIKIYLPLFYIDHIQKIIFQSRNFYEIETLNLLKKQYKSFNNILEIGANIGNHMLYYCSRLDAKAVHCFEPNSLNFENLQKNVALNNLEDRVFLYKKAAGDAMGRGREKNFSLANTGMNAVEKLDDTAGDNTGIEIVTIDSFHFSNLNFIKIDVEGFELEVLKGARQTLQVCNPVVMVEVFENNKPKVDEWMHSLGYKEVLTIEAYNIIYAKEKANEVIE